MSRGTRGDDKNILMRQGNGKMGAGNYFQRRTKLGASPSPMMMPQLFLARREINFLMLAEA